MEAGSEIEELRRRVRELERLVEQQAEQLRDRDPRRLVVGALALDLVEGRATLAGRDVRLLPREFGILATLARQPGKVARRDELRRAVWGDALHSSTNVIAVHMSRLRAQLGEDHVRIVSRRGPGSGYVLEVGLRLR